MKSLTLRQALARIADLEAQVAALTPSPKVKPNKSAPEWMHPALEDREASLTDSREWRNVSWNNTLTGGKGSPPGPWERDYLTKCELLGIKPRIHAAGGAKYRGGTRGEREAGAKQALEALGYIGEVAHSPITLSL
jgi:hypothetical protein